MFIHAINFTQRCLAIQSNYQSVNFDLWPIIFLQRRHPGRLQRLAFNKGWNGLGYLGVEDNEHENLVDMSWIFHVKGWSVYGLKPRRNTLNGSSDRNKLILLIYPYVIDLETCFVSIYNTTRTWVLHEIV